MSSLSQTHACCLFCQLNERHNYPRSAAVQEARKMLWSPHHPNAGAAQTDQREDKRVLQRLLWHRHQPRSWRYRELFQLSSTTGYSEHLIHLRSPWSLYLGVAGHCPPHLGQRAITGYTGFDGTYSALGDSAPSSWAPTALFPGESEGPPTPSHLSGASGLCPHLRVATL